VLFRAKSVSEYRKPGRNTAVSRNVWTFRQRDVTRALKATIAAGVDVRRIEIDREGKIVVVTGKPGEASDDRSANEWEDAE